MRSASALGGGRTYARVFDARAAPTLENFPCSSLCMECRFLADPVPGGDPMRTDSAGVDRPACPHCFAQAWADLRNRDTASMVRDVDEADAAQRRKRLHRRVLRAIACGTVLAAVIAARSAAVEPAAFDLSMMALVTLYAVIEVVVFRATTVRKSPSRWYLPTPRVPARAGVRHQGAAETKTMLRAPLTGRPCVAYELAIRDNPHPNAAPRTWSLLEQRNVDMTVGGVPIGRDQARLVLRRTRIQAKNIALDSTQLEAALRSRGLNPSRRHVVYETVIAPETPLSAWSDENHPTRLEVATSARGLATPEPRTRQA